MSVTVDIGPAKSTDTIKRQGEVENTLFLMRAANALAGTQQRHAAEEEEVDAHVLTGRASLHIIFCIVHKNGSHLLIIRPVRLTVTYTRWSGLVITSYC